MSTATLRDTSLRLALGTLDAGQARGLVTLTLIQAGYSVPNALYLVEKTGEASGPRREARPLTTEGDRL